MPTYQYACTACDNQFEIVQKFSDDALTVCPSCQGELRKVFSAVGIVFKGSGFYRTDSRSSGSSTVSSTTSSSSNSSSSSASSSGPTESKPATAAPAAAAS
ncbi:FmdB family zinc ribbon protein [Planomonospora algeriensis]